MKHKLTLTRHCEEGVARRGNPFFLYFFTVLAMMVSLLFSSNPAFACLESKTYPSLIRSAEIIFEGHFVSKETQDVTSVYKGVEKTHSTEVLTFEVDKNWKGTKEGQLIQSTISAFYQGDTEENTRQGRNRMFILKKRGYSADMAVIYGGSACPDGIIWGQADIKSIQEMLSHQWKFWPFWAFYSATRWIGNLI